MNIEKDDMISNQYEVHIKNTLPTVNQPLHYHDFYECYIHLDGEASYAIDSKIYKLEPNDIVIINKNQLHRAIIEETVNHYKRMVLWIDCNFIENLRVDGVDLLNVFSGKDKKDVLRLPREQAKEIQSLFLKIDSERTKCKNGYMYLLQVYITETLILLNRYGEDFIFVEEVAFTNDKVIESLLNYLDQNYSYDVKIDKLAQHFFLSKFHLMRKFKKYTGLTINEYVRKKKLVKAKELLLTGIPITEVYKNCGFGDYSNFLRAFNETYNMSPTEYKKYIMLEKKLNLMSKKD